MEMFLLALCLSLFGVAVSAVMFGAATRGLPADEPAAAAMDAAAEQAASAFFVRPPAQPPADAVPLEALLLRIERHVRLEQAAAESFHAAPTAASLHVRTTSPLVH
jgi:hypothetical protein